MDETKTITVYANPYAAIDHKGKPHGVVAMVDVDGAQLAYRYVGAMLDMPASQKAGYNVFQFLEGEDGKPLAVTVPFQGVSAGYYARKILDGDLVVATEADAVLCGISTKDFKPGLEQLEVERAHAAHRHFGAHGKSLPWFPEQAGEGGAVKFGGHAVPSASFTNAKPKPAPSPAKPDETTTISNPNPTTNLPAGDEPGHGEAG